jgi:hypothetical protein
MIFTDGIHLVSDISLKELHCFADVVGLKREWFQDHDKHPHYDITTKRKLRCVLDAGAFLISSKELVKRCFLK